MSRLDGACDAIDLVAATVDTLAGIIENDTFGVDLVDRCASPLRVVSPKTSRRFRISKVEMLFDIFVSSFEAIGPDEHRLVYTIDRSGCSREARLSWNDAKSPMQVTGDAEVPQCLKVRLFANFELLATVRRRTCREPRLNEAAGESDAGRAILAAPWAATTSNVSAPVELAGYGQETDWINAGIIHRMDTHNFRDRDGCWRACWTLLASNYSAISVWSEEFRRRDDVLRSALGSAALRGLRTDRV
jgi:hypothetical protein